jgi:TPP-dependent 2-oxoacid decarboxylase
LFGVPGDYNLEFLGQVEPPRRDLRPPAVGDTEERNTEKRI